MKHELYITDAYTKYVCYNNVCDKTSRKLDCKEKVVRVTYSSYLGMGHTRILQLCVMLRYCTKKSEV